MDKIFLGLTLLLAVVALIALLAQTPTLSQQPPQITILPNGTLTVVP